MIPNELRKKKDNCVSFWYVDIDTLNISHGGALKALQELQAYPGVQSVDILPLLRDPTGISEEGYYEILDYLTRFIDGPIASF